MAGAVAEFLTSAEMVPELGQGDGRRFSSSDLQTLVAQLQARVSRLEARVDAGPGSYARMPTASTSSGLSDSSCRHKGAKIPPSCSFGSPPSSARGLGAAGGWSPPPALLGLAAAAAEARGTPAANGTSAQCSPGEAEVAVGDGAAYVTEESGGREDWDFDEGSYSVGVIALVTRGLPSALPHLALAALTPTLQLICYLALFSEMITENITPNLDGIRLLTTFACFFLMGLMLMTEVQEGFKKMIFCCRCAYGKYAEVCPRAAVLGVCLGFSQLVVPCYIMGLSMQLVLGAESVLDAFTCYVALIFITEIDNYLTDSPMVKNFFKPTANIHVHKKRVAGAGVAAAAAVTTLVDGGSAEPWAGRAMWFTNLGVVLVQPLNVVFVAVADTPTAMDLEWWAGQVPGFVLLFAALNVAMWLGAHSFGAARAAFYLAGFTLSILGALYAANIDLDIDVIQPLSTMALFMFSTMSLPAAAATAIDPFILLGCPYRLPCISWLIMLGATMWTWHFSKFQYA